MKLLFVFPCWQKLLESRPDLAESLSGYKIGDFRMAGLGVCTAAGAVPAGVELELIDEHVDEVDLDARPDAVCLSFFTPQATRAYQIGDAFRARGVPVIAGGIHPSVMPDEALAHADAVVKGPVEGLWETILSDLSAGTLQRRYEGRLDAPFARVRRELMAHSSYLKSGIVQTSRGCHFDCGFCVVPPYCGSRVVLRDIDAVLEDIASLPYRSFFFGDENLLFPDAENRAYRRELLGRMAEHHLRKHAFMANYPHFVVALEQQDIELMARALVRQIYLVAGLRRPLAVELADQRLVRSALAMKACGIEVFASFTLGTDQEQPPVEPLVAAFCEAAEINLAEFVIDTPFPGTERFAELERSGRIVHRNWEQYNGANVVFEPLHESREALLARYLGLWQRFYRGIDAREVRRRYMRGFGPGVFQS